MRETPRPAIAEDEDGPLAGRSSEAGESLPLRFLAREQSEPENWPNAKGKLCISSPVKALSGLVDGLPQLGEVLLQRVRSTEDRTWDAMPDQHHRRQHVQSSGCRLA